MNDKEEVLVRWRNEGAMWNDGIALPRKPGNQDIMDFKTAKALQTTGRIEIVCLASEVQTVEVVEDVDCLDAVPKLDEDE